MNEPMVAKERSQARRFVALLVIGTATAQALGLTLKMPTQLEANDISRWCTVWSLLERGTYAIDDCPWQNKTQDKVYKPAPFEHDANAVKHFYSSKPPLLPTLIAGLLYPARAVVGVPLDDQVLQTRVTRPVRQEVKDKPGTYTVVAETPEPVKWPAYVLYLKPVIVLLNVVPMCIFLALYARLLDRYAQNDWAWFVSLFAAAWGTQLFAFEQTLNNHTVAAFSAFFALYAFQRLWDEDRRSPVLFAVAGFFGAFCACNELPAALFGLGLFGMLLFRFPRPTLVAFVPAAAIPCLAFLATQYLAMGNLLPAYADAGGESYKGYEGSYWNTPLEFDWFDQHPESWPSYLFHMLLGHHGVFSLTPIFLFSAYAIVRHLLGRDRRLTALAWLTAFLTGALVAFYAWKTHNYGGSTQGLRWLFWLFPFWLIFLPLGLEPGQDRHWFRGLSFAALLVSVFSIGYAL